MELQKGCSVIGDSMGELPGACCSTISILSGFEEGSAIKYNEGTVFQPLLLTLSVWVCGDRLAICYRKTYIYDSTAYVSPWPPFAYCHYIPGF